MIEIQTSRLVIKPSDQDSWLICDKSDKQTLGTITVQNHIFDLKLHKYSLGLGVATEAAYALMRSLNQDKYFAKSNTHQFLTQLGFKALHGDETAYELYYKNLILPDPYFSLNEHLGIDTSALKTKQHLTSCQLVESDIDCFNRPTRLNPHAASAWQAMKSQAQNEGINLQLASAFRSMRYQADLIQRKLDCGESIDHILKTNTAPGHSEHHTGGAMDITTDGFKPIEQEFDQSPAFHWLTLNAAKFGFVMSYPKDNKQGIIYEPWHWCYHHQPKKIRDFIQ